LGYNEGADIRDGKRAVVKNVDLKENWPEYRFWPAGFLCGAAGNRTRFSTWAFAT
jgi:hypothetical protein